MCYLTLVRTELCNPFIVEKNYLLQELNRNRKLHSFLSMSSQQKLRSSIGEHISVVRSDLSRPFKMHLFIYLFMVNVQFNCLQMYLAILFHLLSWKHLWHQHFGIKTTHQNNVIHRKWYLLITLNDSLIGYLPLSLFLNSHTPDIDYTYIKKS